MLAAMGTMGGENRACTGGINAYQWKRHAEGFFRSASPCHAPQRARQRLHVLWLARVTVSAAPPPLLPHTESCALR